MRQFKVIALTHRTLGLELVGKFHVEPENQKERFAPILQSMQIHEFMFVSTCNRVEFFFRSDHELNEVFTQELLSNCYPELSQNDIAEASRLARLYNNLDAVRHIFHVASSLDSLVVGEREIITQVRNAYNLAKDNGFTGDFTRIAITKAIETAKQIYTETAIATKPVSVVNLAYRNLLERQLTSDMDVVYIGAGQTIEAIAGNLQKHTFKSITIFNRTIEKAQKLGSALGGNGYALNQLEDHLPPFDLLITCTGAEGAVIDTPLFNRWTERSPGKKIIVDLAIPGDIDPIIAKEFDVDYIAIEGLKDEAKRNLKDREKEIFHCEALVEAKLDEFEQSFKTRKMELAMTHVPKMMKEIKSRAMSKTFAKEIEEMDPKSRETLEKVLVYLEKKYISVPMKMAREIILDQDLKDSILD